MAACCSNRHCTVPRITPARTGVDIYSSWGKQTGQLVHLTPVEISRGWSMFLHSFRRSHISMRRKKAGNCLPYGVWRRLAALRSWKILSLEYVHKHAQFGELSLPDTQGVVARHLYWPFSGSLTSDYGRNTCKDHLFIWFQLFQKPVNAVMYFPTVCPNYNIFTCQFLQNLDFFTVQLPSCSSSWCSSSCLSSVGRGDKWGFPGQLHCHFGPGTKHKRPT